MVSPEIEVLSVFMTPWMNPTSSQRDDQIGLARDDAVQQRMIGAVGICRIRIMPRDDVIGELPHGLGIAARGEILEGSDPDVAGGDAGQDSAGQRRLAQARSRRSITAASERVVGIPSAAIASLTMYSRKTGPSAARPSPRRENGVGPDPFS